MIIEWLLAYWLVGVFLTLIVVKHEEGYVTVGNFIGSALVFWIFWPFGVLQFFEAASAILAPILNKRIF